MDGLRLGSLLSPRIIKFTSSGGTAGSTLLGGEGVSFDRFNRSGNDIGPGPHGRSANNHSYIVQAKEYTVEDCVVGAPFMYSQAT